MLVDVFCFRSHWVGGIAGEHLSGVSLQECVDGALPVWPRLDLADTDSQSLTIQGLRVLVPNPIPLQECWRPETSSHIGYLDLSDYTASHTWFLFTLYILIGSPCSPINGPHTVPSWIQQVGKMMAQHLKQEPQKAFSLNSNQEHGAIFLIELQYHIPQISLNVPFVGIGMAFLVATYEPAASRGFVAKPSNYSQLESSGPLFVGTLNPAEGSWRVLVCDSLPSQFHS